MRDCLIIIAPRFDDYFAEGQRVTTTEVAFFSDCPMRMKIREDYRAVDQTFESRGK
jgi:hypothetical protein